MPLELILGIFDQACLQVRAIGRLWRYSSRSCFRKGYLAQTSLMPASSITARAEEPATTPRPRAGKILIMALPHLASTACGIVICGESGTLMMCFLASRVAFSTAEAVSKPLPNPTPTRPLLVAGHHGHAEIHAATAGRHAGDATDVYDLGIEFRLDAFAAVAAPASPATARPPPRPMPEPDLRSARTAPPASAGLS